MIIEIVKYLAVWTILWLGSFDNVYLVHKHFLKQLKQVTDKVIWGIFSLMCLNIIIKQKLQYHFSEHGKISSKILFLCKSKIHPATKAHSQWKK